MHRVPAFEVTDRRVVAGLIRDLALAQVVTGDAGRPGGLHRAAAARHADRRTLAAAGHLARANPQARTGAVGVPCLALFVGPQAYVSPSAYPTAAPTCRAVPTWNYVEVHVHGTFRLTDDAATTLTVVSELTDVHEAGRPAPWRVADAPDGYVEGLAGGIVAFEIEVDRVEAKAKLSQNRPEDDRRGVVADLAALGGTAARVADLMASSRFDPPDPRPGRAPASGVPGSRPADGRDG